MLLREAARGDVPQLADVWYAMLEETGMLVQPVDPRWRELVVAEFLRAFERRARWLIVEESGRLVSSGGLFLRREPAALALTGFTATVAGMFTHPGFRRRGCARRIVGGLIEFARAEGCRTIHLRASAAGRPLYESLGFQPGDDMQLAL